MGNIIKNFLRKMGWEVNRYNFHNAEPALIKKVLDYYSIDQVIDVGANVGQYSLDVVDSGFKGSILSFEPIGEAFAKLEAASSSYPQWEVFNKGVGSIDGELELNVSVNLVSSSFLDITKTTLAAQPTTRYGRKEAVKIITLDTFFKERQLGKSPLLKLDVQGYELEVLKGALTCLPKVAVIQAELSFVRLYEGGPLYGEFLSFMQENNFEVYTIIPGFRDPLSGKMLQADGIFINRDRVIN